METCGDTLDFSRNTEKAEVPSREGCGDKKKRDNQYKYWSFTYFNYKNETKETMEMKFLLEILKHECIWYIMQEEICPDTGKEHLQGCLYLKDRKRLSGIKKLGPNDIHWTDTRKISASAYYCCNRSKRKPHGQLYSHGIDIPDEDEEPIELQEPYGWQNEVMDIIETKPNNRDIHWFWEPTGKVGKTTLIKYLMVKKDALVASGKSNDIFHLISKYPKKRKIIIINAPRASQEFISYGALEHIKDGVLFSGKYNSDQLVFNYPHVFVFANCPPKHGGCIMSTDKIIEHKIVIN